MRRLSTALLLAALVLSACSRPVPTTPPDAPDPAPAPAPPQEADPQKAYREALDLIADRDYYTAEAKLEEIVKQDPQFADAWNDLAFVRVQKYHSLLRHPALPGEGSEHEPAVEAARKALELRPGWPFAQYNLGEALLANGEWAAAVEPLGESAHQQPDRPEPQTALGLALMGVARFDEAAAACRKALELNPGDQLASGCLDQLADGGAPLSADEAAIGSFRWDPAARDFSWVGEPGQAPESEFSPTSPPWTCAVQYANGYREGFVDCDYEPWRHYWGAERPDAGTTPAGVGIGTTLADVTRIYGAGRRSGDLLLYPVGDLLLGLKLNDQDRVTYYYFRTRTPYFLIDELINGKA